MQLLTLLTVILASATTALKPTIASITTTTTRQMETMPSIDDDWPTRTPDGGRALTAFDESAGRSTASALVAVTTTTAGEPVPILSTEASTGGGCSCGCAKKTASGFRTVVVKKAEICGGGVESS